MAQRGGDGDRSTKALEAVWTASACDMNEAAVIGDLFITLTAIST